MTVKQKKNLRYYLRRISREFNDRGARGFVLWITSVALHKGFRTNEAAWYRLLLKEFVSTVPNPRGGIVFDVMSFEEAFAFFRNNHDAFRWMYREEEIRVARHALHEFTCLREGSEVIGYIKLGVERIFVSDFSKVLLVPPLTAFIYDTFILPSHRNIGLGSFLIAKTAEYAQQKGYHNLWCHIPSWNRASVKAYAHVGFRPVGHVRLFRICGKDLFIVRSPSSALSIQRVTGRAKELQLGGNPAYE